MALGKQLREARERQGLTASQVAAATRMKVQIVEAIEREDFSKIAAPIYGRGFIKFYADLVGVDPGPLLQEYAQRLNASNKKTPSLMSEGGGKRPVAMPPRETAPEGGAHPAPAPLHPDESHVQVVADDRGEDVAPPAPAEAEEPDLFTLATRRKQEARPPERTPPASPPPAPRPVEAPPAPPVEAPPAPTAPLPVSPPPAPPRPAPVKASPPAPVVLPAPPPVKTPPPAPLAPPAPLPVKPAPPAPPAPAPVKLAPPAPPAPAPVKLAPPAPPAPAPVKLAPPARPAPEETRPQPSSAPEVRADDRQRDAEPPDEPRDMEAWSLWQSPIRAISIVLGLVLVILLVISTLSRCVVSPKSTQKNGQRAELQVVVQPPEPYVE